MDKRKFDVYARELGCVVCRLYENNPGEPADLHHPAPGRKRLGDDVFMALCPWHHRGVCSEGMSPGQMEKRYGFSLALNKKQFINHYGDEAFLLRAQEELYEKWKSLTGL